MQRSPWGATFSLVSLFSLSACTTAETPAVTPMSLNDVAVLFPLPASLAEDTLLRADSAGDLGPLFPAYAQREVYFGFDPVDLVPRLRLVALNVDDCFPHGRVGEADCERQIRVIFQPIAESGGIVTTDDVAVHVFYDLTEDAFASFVEDVSALNAGAAGFDLRAPVGVHPVMRAEGPGGPYAQAYQALLLRYCGAAVLTKVTIMALQGGGVGWSLSGVDFVGTTPTDIAIAGTPENDTRQELRQTLTGSSDFLVSLDPATEFTDGLASLFDSDAARAASDEAVASAVRVSLEIDDPRSERNPATTDCASCHLATPLRNWAVRERGVDLSTFGAAVFQSDHWDLTNRSEVTDNASAMRCFGYFGAEIAISQRTINEAAAVADSLNETILGVSVEAP